GRDPPVHRTDAVESRCPARQGGPGGGLPGQQQQCQKQAKPTTRHHILPSAALHRRMALYPTLTRVSAIGQHHSKVAEPLQIQACQSKTAVAVPKSNSSTGSSK